MIVSPNFMDMAEFTYYVVGTIFMLVSMFVMLHRKKENSCMPNKHSHEA